LPQIISLKLLRATVDEVHKLKILFVIALSLEINIFGRDLAGLLIYS